MLLKGRNLIKSEDFSVEEIDQILSLSQNIIENPSKYSRVCEGKLLATLFYEPSTRTRLSFESAMYRLGGSVVGFSEPNSSSVSKGESLGDTIRTVSCYADAIVMRHPVAGSAKEAAKYTEVPARPSTAYFFEQRPRSCKESVSCLPPYFASSWLIRGSSAEYSTSTTIIITATQMLMTRYIPINNG